MEISLLALLQKAYLTGWLVAAPIGPVNLEIIRRGLRRGFLPGFMLGLGACSIDFIYFIVFSIGLGAVLRLPTVSIVAFFLGGAVLCWLGWDALREARKYAREAEAPEEKAIQELPSAPDSDGGAPGQVRFAYRPLGSYLVGLGMTAANPMTLAFWSALALEFANLPLRYRMAAAGALLSGCLSWVLLLTTLLAFARRRVGPGLFAWVTFLGGAVVLYFGGRFLARGIGLILGM